MKPLGALRVLVAFVVLLVLHFTLRPFLGWRVGPDFLLMAVLVVAVRVRPGTAALFGLLVGLVADSIGTDQFGAAALGFTVVGYGASWLQSAVFADDLMVTSMMFFFGEWLFDAVFYFAARSGGAEPVLVPLFVLAPMRAGVTALFGVVMLMILRPVLQPPDR